MNFMNQKEALEQLEVLADYDRHSILISGPTGCGKSYLVKQYGTMLGIRDIQFVAPQVQAIKDAVNECMKQSNPILLSIENLDSGVIAVSYTLLKFLEEPTQNVYVVVTCRNVNRVPDTIISRSATVVVSPPRLQDIAAYAQSKDASRFNQPVVKKICECVRTYSEIDEILKMNNLQLEYISDLESLLGFNDTVTNIVWRLGHYEDGSETPIQLVLQYIISRAKTEHIRQAARTCLQDLSIGRLGTQAVLSRFAFECRYCQ